MTTMTLPTSSTTSELAADVELACRRIAPTWPLDRFLAVNPYQGFADHRIEHAAAELGALHGTTLTMPRAWFREQWRAGRFGRAHLAAAIRQAGVGATVDELIATMAEPSPAPAALPLVTDLADEARRRTEPQPWSELVVHQISQHAAAWFDRAQAAWRPDHAGGLYASWREVLAADRGLPMRAGHRQFARRVQALPAEPFACLAAASAALGLSPSQRRTWLVALLGSVRGWAAWCAYERWQARLAGGDDDHVVHLLAMRAAWEWLLVDDLGLQPRLPAFRQRLDQHDAEVARLARAQAPDWLLQHALEFAYQHELAAGIAAGAAAPAGPASTPVVQAVFCIDVRSERFRRALEAAGGDLVATRGFAGFFGLPIAYAPLGTEATRPQLPGLLAPQRTTTQVAEGDHGELAARRRGTLVRRQRWGRFRGAAASAFTFVESCGLFAAVDLLRNAVGRALPPRAEDAGLRPDVAARLRPSWGTAAPPSADERVATAAAVLRAMGLGQGFARLVLLAGHGSTSANNPHQKGLDCGACGGQTGEVNARLLAELLNDADVRAGLRREGIGIPATTWFVAGLHDTTTDDLRLFDVDRLPASHAADLEQLQRWLAAAGRSTRAERAPSLGLAALQDQPEALAAAVRRRASDWSQVRPEWGLADCAAFVVAPRVRTRHLDLGGRVFLHDYDWRRDCGFATLTLILTAPMVVTNWINLQYHASTVDNRRFGSGNKVLHNVVGGTLGVFEGNGGDLRIGLPMQSLHDGERWRHTPQRLSVFVEAPAAAIDAVLAAHANVRLLVDHGWLHLLRIDEHGATHRRLAGGGWTALAQPTAERATRTDGAPR